MEEHSARQAGPGGEKRLVFGQAVRLHLVRCLRVEQPVHGLDDAHEPRGLRRVVEEQLGEPPERHALPVVEIAEAAAVEKGAPAPLLRPAHGRRVHLLRGFRAQDLGDRAHSARPARAAPAPPPRPRPRRRRRPATEARRGRRRARASSRRARLAARESAGQKETSGGGVNGLDGDEAQALGAFGSDALVRRPADEIAGCAPQVWPHDDVARVRLARSSGEIPQRIGGTEHADRRRVHRGRHVHGAGVRGEEQVERADHGQRIDQGRAGP